MLILLTYLGLVVRFTKHGFALPCRWCRTDCRQGLRPGGAAAADGRSQRAGAYLEEVRELICVAPRTPVGIDEQMCNVMATQWVRGTEWAIDHARAFRDEVRQRVDQNVAACPNESIRLMWVGAGLWHATDFYTAFEQATERSSSGRCVWLSDRMVTSVMGSTIRCGRCQAGRSA
jgi:hypothetical protein